MRIHWKYLKYILRHKWFVFLGCIKLSRDKTLEYKIRDLGVVPKHSFFWPLLWFSIVHDWSKFRPSEWFPYADWFNGFFGIGWSQEKYGGCGDEIAAHKRASKAFDVAWLKHQHRNKHHWQYWLLQEDDGPTKTLEIPDIYLLEMIADWYGAGRAITGRETISPWYEENKHRIVTHPRTCETIEAVIRNFDEREKL